MPLSYCTALGGVLHILRYPRGGTLSPQYLRPFLIQDGLTGIYDVFHVSQLKKYRPNADQVLSEEPLILQLDLSYMERLVRIIEKSVKELRN
jgi:hypothetical protein